MASIPDGIAKLDGNLAEALLRDLGKMLGDSKENSEIILFVSQFAKYCAGMFHSWSYKDILGNFLNLVTAVPQVAGQESPVELASLVIVSMWVEKKNEVRSMIYN